MALSRVQEAAIYLLIAGTFALVAMTDGLSWPTLIFCLALGLVRAVGLTISTRAGCALLLAVAGMAPLYWFFLRTAVNLNIKDFLLAVLMVFLLGAQTGRDFAAVSSYCVWIMLAALFPSSGPRQWMLLGVLFLWFLVVQSLNEVRRNREQLAIWQGPEGWALLRPLAGFLLAMTVGIVLLSGILYTLLPRAPVMNLRWNLQPMRRLIGFSGTVRLGEIGRLQENRMPAFRVRFLKGSPPPVLRFRGLALADFNGTTWTNNLESWYEYPGQGGIPLASDEQRRRPGDRLYYEIQTLAAMDRVLFTAGLPEYLYLPEGRLRRNAEGALRQISLGERQPAYSISGWLDPEVPGTAVESAPNLGLAMRQRYLSLPVTNPRMRELAEQITAGAKGPAEAAARVEAFLRTRYRYSLESNIGGRDPLVDFLFHARAGHCEYFASSMAVLLRMVKVPTRVVTGFYAALPEPVGPWHIIRSSSAHSWVEVWVDGRGWVTYDPTPPGSNLPQPPAALAWILRLQDRLVVMGEEGMGGVSGLRRPHVEMPELSPWWLPTLALPVGWWAWRRRGPKAEKHEATVLMEQFLKKEGIVRQADMTARETAPAEVAALYEAARFSRDPEALPRFRRALAEWIPADRSKPRESAEVERR
jgi:transglutaminase-like putative cysteine protease